MSWDLFAQDLPAGLTSLDDLPDDFSPRPLQIARANLLRAIVDRWPSADASDPTWVVVEGDDWSMECNLGSEDPVDSFALHLRGGLPPLPAIADLLTALGAGAIDAQSESGVFTLESAVESFGGWAAYRDQASDQP